MKIKKCHTLVLTALTAVACSRQGPVDQSDLARAPAAVPPFDLRPAERLNSTAPLDLTYGRDGRTNTERRVTRKSIYVDATHGVDGLGGGSIDHPYLTIDRALGDVPDLVDAGYTIELAAGTYHEEVTLDRFVMPSGTMKSTWSMGALPARFLAFHGNEAAPESVVIEGNTFCFNASSALLLLHGLSCRRTKDAGVEVSGGGLVLDDVSFSDNGTGAVMVEHSLLNLGGKIRCTNSGALVFSIRNNSFARDSTPWHAGVDLSIDGGTRAGIFVRDHSALAFQSVESRISIHHVSPWAFNVQQHSHVFGGIYDIGEVNTAFQVEDFSYINADISSASHLGSLVTAFRSSFVSLERVSNLSDIGNLMEIDPASWGRVGDERKPGAAFVPPTTPGAVAPW
jgi:hypothetical protein